MANVVDQLTTPSVAILDTSIFIARESGRRLDTGGLPAKAAVSAVTIGELRWGVLMAQDDDTRSRRLDTLNDAMRLEPTPVDEQVAAAWSLLKQRLKAAGAKMEINDSWIAATAFAHGWAVATHDDGFPDGIAGLTVVRA